MALNTQIWIDDIVEGFWPDNSFIARSVDHSSYVNNHTVHIPQAGSAPQVTKNRSSFPATIGTREDSIIATLNRPQFEIKSSPKSSNN